MAGAEMTSFHPIITADVVLVAVHEDRLKVLLIQRDNEPYRDHWALPGAVLDVDLDRSLEVTAKRALDLRIKLKVPHFEPVAVFSGPNRDPRGYSISVVYLALLPSDQAAAIASLKVRDVVWSDVNRLKHPLAFDHGKIIEVAIKHLRKKVEQFAQPLHLLPTQFTLSELQRMCEIVLQHPLDKRNFRRRLEAEKCLIEIDGSFQHGSFRPAQLYRKAATFRF